MKKQRLTIITFLLMLILFANCGKDNSVNPKSELNIAPNTVTFSDEIKENKLYIQNDSNEMLIWNVTNKPDWIVISKISDTLAVNEQDSIDISINKANLENGDYSGNIKFSSNSNNITISVLLSFHPSIDIFPGVGAGDIELGYSLNQVTSVLGEPLEIIQWRDYQNDSLSTKTMDYTNLGMQVILTHYTLQYQVGVIKLFSTCKFFNGVVVCGEYQGVTEKLLGIDYSFSRVVACYGQPEEIIERYHVYRYPSMGINFFYDDDSEFISGINIYEKSSNNLLKKLTSRNDTKCLYPNIQEH